jgi:hypothetical protein
LFLKANGACGHPQEHAAMERYHDISLAKLAELTGARKALRVSVTDRASG